jgi:hypothetical protein
VAPLAQALCKRSGVVAPLAQALCKRSGVVAPLPQTLEALSARPDAPLAALEERRQVLEKNQ